MNKKAKRKLFWFLFILILWLSQTALQVLRPTHIPEGMLEVHCIDVGQGDSTLILGETQTMLIDAAEQEYADEICLYLSELGIKKIDYLVATHPHDDHIGGMADVMSQFRVDCLVLTDEPSDINDYQNMLYTAEQKEIPILIPETGDMIPFADAQCTVLGPVTMDQNNSNNNSMIVKLTYGEVDFLFMGDAERSLERDLVDGWDDLSSEVLRVGHHGSDTSSNQFFLERVMPEYAVISCGLNNQFGHPSSDAIHRLKAWCKEIYRTDLDGSVVITTNGTDIELKE
ncbi:MAG: MBL fold metallo-hydrolase [Ruminococcaceae bacterium]|nr:MBL fold metallo-hydrolase [Oscillospiraceae bacterium]